MGYVRMHQVCGMHLHFRQYEYELKNFTEAKKNTLQFIISYIWSREELFFSFVCTYLRLTRCTTKFIVFNDKKKCQINMPIQSESHLNIDSCRWRWIKLHEYGWFLKWHCCNLHWYDMCARFIKKKKNQATFVWSSIYLLSVVDFSFRIAYT